MDRKDRRIRELENEIAKLRASTAPQDPPKQFEKPYQELVKHLKRRTANVKDVKEMLRPSQSVLQVNPSLLVTSKQTTQEKDKRKLSLSG